jgi:hypothetical protein
VASCLRSQLHGQTFPFQLRWQSPGDWMDPPSATPK